MLCKICQKRKPRRYCPGITADICSQCCGNEREVTIACPLDCEYLRESRIHEKPLPFDPKDLPNSDIRISDSFLEKNEDAVVYLGLALSDAAIKTEGAVDSDMREALDALTRTYRTLVNGLYYETRPVNPYAVEIMDMVQREIKLYREAENPRDADLLGVLVLFQGLAFRYNTGRPKGRSFIDFVGHEFRKRLTPPASVVEEAPKLIEL